MRNRRSRDPKLANDSNGRDWLAGAVVAVLDVGELLDASHHLVDRGLAGNDLDQEVVDRFQSMYFTASERLGAWISSGLTYKIL